MSLQVGQPYTPYLMLGSGPGQGLIPALTAPPDSVLHASGGGGGSDDSAYNTADLETELTPSELAAYYQPQLEAAGWQRIRQSESEYVAWSAWRLTDDSGMEWSGSLMVSTSPASAGDRFLLRVDRLRQN